MKLRTFVYFSSRRQPTRTCATSSSRGWCWWPPSLLSSLRRRPRASLRRRLRNIFCESTIWMYFSTNMYMVKVYRHSREDCCIIALRLYYESVLEKPCWISWQYNFSVIYFSMNDYLKKVRPERKWALRFKLILKFL